MNFQFCISDPLGRLNLFFLQLNRNISKVEIQRQSVASVRHFLKVEMQMHSV